MEETESIYQWALQKTPQEVSSCGKDRCEFDTWTALTVSGWTVPAVSGLYLWSISSDLVLLAKEIVTSSPDPTHLSNHCYQGSCNNLQFKEFYGAYFWFRIAIRTGIF